MEYDHTTIPSHIPTAFQRVLCGKIEFIAHIHKAAFGPEQDHSSSWEGHRLSEVHHCRIEYKGSKRSYMMTSILLGFFSFRAA